MTPERIGKYDVIAPLGEGGMAVVWRGFDPVIRRPVALKVLVKADLVAAGDPSVLERFRREAQAAGNLQHPNIVAIYEYGEDDERAFIAMELIEGQTLQEHLRAGWRPDAKTLPQVLEQMFEALDFSHSRNVIHRDIKPGNVLISNMGVAKISDFGIARIERSSVTQAGDVLGTPFYMSPEQFNGQPADERSDIYSAGVIVYEVLTGQRPFDGRGGRLLKQVLEELPRAPSGLQSSLPVAGDAVLLKALAKDPAARYQSVHDFVAALHTVFPRKPDRPGPIGAEAASTVPTTAAGSTKRVAGNLGALRRAIGAQGGAASTTKAGARAAPPAPQRMKPAVLCVDDEHRVLNALEFLLRDRYEVVTADGGAKALEQLKARRFHVLVSDQRMPGMTGVELLGEARALAPTMVRILLTGYSDLAAIVGSVNESEIFRFVSKPWQQDALIATLEEAVDVAIALEASPPPAAPAAGATDLVALVLEDEATARAVRQIAGGACRVVHAPKLDDALEALAKHEVAVLIADLESQKVDHTALFKVLKAEHPQTLVVVTTTSSDSELIIELINEARIFRFINKPVNLTLLGRHLTAALERYHAFRKSPGLLRAQAAKRVQDSGAGRSILERLKSLGARFSSAIKG